ncbi:MAG: hypothetical protein WBW84_16725 [Acidobacteriaceae bacterium]
MQLLDLIADGAERGDGRFRGSAERIGCAFAAIVSRIIGTARNVIERRLKLGEALLLRRDPATRFFESHRD